MTNAAPEIQEYIERVREIALKLPDAEEYFPWKNRAFFRSMKGRNFLFANERDDYLDVTLRLPPAEHAVALQQPFVASSIEMGENGWLTAKIRTEAELETVIPWIEASYALSKPFRSKKEVVGSEAPEVPAFLEQVRHVALSYGDIEEYFPYGERAFRKLKGQIFLYTDERGDHLLLKVRLPMDERDYALSLPDVDVPKYIGYKGWIAVKVKTQADLEMVLPWIRMSYDENNPARKVRAKKKPLD